jgi:hypothetical protein
MTNENKVGKQPEGPGGQGILVKEGEVQAHGQKIFWTCWHCGHLNAADSDWKWFTCANCGYPSNISDSQP